MVGTERFELSASCSQSRRANQTTLRPETKLARIGISVRQAKQFQSIFNILINMSQSAIGFALNASTHHDALMRLER